MRKYFSKLKGVIVSGVVLAGMGLANAASAAVPIEVEAMFTSIAADGLTMFGYAVVLWAALSGLYTLFKVGNKMKSKAGAA